jgi:hypothetical protein
MAKGIGSVCLNTEVNSLLEVGLKSREMPGELSTILPDT